MKISRKRYSIKNTIFIVVFIAIISATLIIIYNSKMENNTQISELLKEKDISSEIIDTTAISRSDNNEVVKKDEDTQQYILFDNYSTEGKKKIEGKDYIKSINKSINKKGTISIQQGADIQHNASEAELLARLINSEAGDEPYAGKLAVGNVVINRSKSQGKSISDVIYQKSQFDGVQTKWFEVEPSPESIKAAQDILSGKSIVGDAYHFANLNLCSPNWATKDKFICRIGDHWFFK